MSWKDQLKNGLRSADDLDPSVPAEVARAFKVRAPRPYLDLIDPTDPNDPIAAQVIPDARELDFRPEELEDPIGDAAKSPVPRLTHRYPDRVLLYPTYQCAVYCRHCFRKEAINDGNRGFSRAALTTALAYVGAHPEVREVILTGGDPLLLTDDQLAWLRAEIEAIPHVRLLRVHTRIPVVLPDRVTPGLVAALDGRLTVVIVAHFNHPREITASAASAARALRKGGYVLMNQAVLLRGINDSADVLEDLCRELVYSLGMIPYYLHHCDLTRGLSHLRVPIEEGLAIVGALRGRLSGVCQPTYVLDLPGGGGKIPLGPSYVEGREAHRWLFRSWEGAVVPYVEVLSADLPVVGGSSQGQGGGG